MSMISNEIKDVQQCDNLEQLEEQNRQAKVALAQLKDKINTLERLGKEQDREEDRVVVLKNVENHQQRMTSNIATLRKTNLSVKMAIDTQERDALMLGSETRKRNINSKETLAKAASKVTESLLELNQTMDAQVRKGNLTLTTLESSSKNITDTHEEFKSMGSHIQNARRLLTKYSQRELTDKVLIFLALVFFFATVLYILQRRIWSTRSSNS
ncbi:vesicle transport protein SEC20-like isoform X3 [Dreissena polymorpha]|uniref:vesicle transport protein SEC20-like isoform X3 n=1 Tax=Dreissena polymorpha TaxID=45954 RepID=UPI0022651D09|nr:vesicle transport protein SEC20-like isoform X3 [Dreissena polymorpha]